MVLFMSEISAPFSPEQRQKLRRYLPDKYALSTPRDEIFLAHGLTQFAFLSEFGETFPLQYEENGKPFIPGRCDVRFSLSHTQGAAICAVGTEPVGVDIEKLRPFPHESLMRLVLPEEFAGRDDAGKLRIWAQKESYVKLIGGAISAMADVRFYPDRISAPENIFFRSYPEISGFAAGACAAAPLPEQVRRVSLEKILEL